MVAKVNAQFFIATHSPILTGISNANNFLIPDDFMERVAQRQTTDYAITKNFLENPEGFLRHWVGVNVVIDKEHVKF